MLDGSNDADCRKSVPVGGFFNIAPYLKGKIPPPKNNPGVWVGVYKPNAQSIWTSIVSKLLHGCSTDQNFHNDIDHQVLVMGG